MNLTWTTTILTLLLRTLFLRNTIWCLDHNVCVRLERSSFTMRLYKRVRLHDRWGCMLTLETGPEKKIRHAPLILSRVYACSRSTQTHTRAQNLFPPISNDIVCKNWISTSIEWLLLINRMLYLMEISKKGLFCEIEGSRCAWKYYKIKLLMLLKI